jgi:hypothetical protein
MPAERGLEEELGEIIRCARAGEYGTCASLWNLCLIQLESLLLGQQLTQAHHTIIGSWLAQLLARQSDSDWVGFADVLEYEFVPVLRTLPRA